MNGGKLELAKYLQRKTMSQGRENREIMAFGVYSAFQRKGEISRFPELA